MPDRTIHREPPEGPRPIIETTEREHAEQQLRESEERIRSLAENVPCVLMRFDRQLRILYLNRQSDRYNDIPAERLLGRTNREVGMPVELCNLWDAAIERVFRTGTEEEMVFDFAGPSGMRTFRLKFAPEFGPGHEVRYVLGVSLDITERKQAEDALRQANELFEKVLGQLDDSFGIFDSQWRCVFLNEAVARRLGRPRDQLLGRDLRELIPQIAAQPAFAHMQAVANERRPRTWTERSPVTECWFEWHAFPWEEGVAVVVREVTDRKQAEEQLIQSQKTLSELVERAPFGIYIVDSTFRISHMNARSLAGAFRNVRPTIGCDFGEAVRILWPETVAAGIISHFRHTLETGESYYSPPFTNPRHDVGIIESYEWELHRMVLPDGQYGVICYYFDSTALRNAELALQEANAGLEKKVEERTQQLRALTGELTLTEQRERSRLANILHDHLQQILVAVKFRLTILGRGGDDIIRQATKEVEDLVDESIAASRSLTAELSPPILHEAGLNEGLQWLARRMANTQGLFVNLELNECGRLPEDVKILLFQSVRELLFNVVKHSNTRSAVVNLRSLDGSLQVTVSDEGTGFNPAVMTRAGEGGRGFGLLSIQERLKYMGGTLEIQSNPGQGSRFVLSVPIASPTVSRPQSREALSLPQAHLLKPFRYPGSERRIRVMVADDHAIVRQGIANLLAGEPDFEIVGQASDGREAIDLAARLLPDVVLMDVSMPKLNGVEATRSIRNELPGIRIIGLSMFEDLERAQAMRDAGAVDYLTKSGQADALVDAIKKSVQAPTEFLSVKPAF